VTELITWALTMWPILAALGLGAIALSAWVIKHDFTVSKSKKANASKQPSQYTRTKIESIEQAEVAWGLWYTGAGMRTDRLFKKGNIKKILLWNPSTQNKDIEENANVVDSKPHLLRQEIELVKEEIVRYKIPYRYYANFRDSSFTIYDLTPTQNESGEFIPNSDNAWICIQYPSWTLAVAQWHCEEIKNQGIDKKKFNKYFSEFQDVWDYESVEPSYMELPFNNKSDIWPQVENTSVKEPVQIETASQIFDSDMGKHITKIKNVLETWKQQLCEMLNQEKLAELQTGIEIEMINKNDFAYFLMHCPSLDKKYDGLRAQRALFKAHMNPYIEIQGKVVRSIASKEDVDKQRKYLNEKMQSLIEAINHSLLTSNEYSKRRCPFCPNDMTKS